MQGIIVPKLDLKLKCAVKGSLRVIANTSVTKFSVFSNNLVKLMWDELLGKIKIKICYDFSP